MTRGDRQASFHLKPGVTWDKIVKPEDVGLKATADLIRQNVAAGVDTYVNVNNRYEGCAPLTIQRLLEILSQGLSR